jgi:hypothetical protein
MKHTLNMMPYCTKHSKPEAHVNFLSPKKLAIVRKGAYGIA